MRDPYRRGLSLEYLTVGYNVAEAALSIILALLAGSVALLGFGLDSVVESLSGLVLVWRLRQHGKGDEEREEMIERRAMRFVALTFWVLAAYVLFEAVRKLAGAERPEASLGGIVIAAASIVVMPLLARAKRRVGEEIGSRALIADSRETLVCAWLSVALLLGLGGNLLFGFWQADPITGIAIVGFLVKEGWENFEAASGEEPG